MLITLTHEQWVAMMPLVKMGERAEERLGVPIDLDNGDQHIEIRTDEVKITLADSE